MEFLERRILMAQDMWTGGGDGKTWQERSKLELERRPGLIGHRHDHGRDQSDDRVQRQLDHRELDR